MKYMVSVVSTFALSIASYGPALAEEFCGEPVEIVFEDDSVLFSTADRELVVIGVPTEDDAGVLFRPRVVYTCSCTAANGYGEATCYPTWNGQSAGCVSMGCSACELKSNKSVVPMDETGSAKQGEIKGSVTQKGREGRLVSANGGEDDGAFAEVCATRQYDETEDADFEVRRDEIMKYMESFGFFELPLNDEKELVAPDGFRIEVEHAGGRSMAYLVPDGRSAPVSMSYEVAVDGAAGAALARPRARCGCADRGSCHWEGIACVGCDSCAITVRGR